MGEFRVLIGINHECRRAVWSRITTNRLPVNNGFEFDSNMTKKTLPNENNQCTMQ